MSTALLDNLTDEIEECETAEDCVVFDSVGNEIQRICYKEVRWSPDDNFCDCSSWFGFTGELCDQPSFQTMFHHASVALDSVWCALIMIAVSWELFSFFATLQSTGKLKLKMLNNTVWTALSLWIAYVMYTVSASVYFVELFEPETMILEESGTENEEVVTRNGKFISTTVFLGFGFVILKSIVIILSWIDIVSVYWSYFKPRKVKKLLHFRRVVLSFSILYFLVVIGVTPTSDPAALGFIITFASLVLMVFYVIGRKLLLGIMQGIIDSPPEVGPGNYKSKNDTKRIQSAVKLIKISSICHIIVLPIIIVAGGVLGSLTQTYQQFIAPGGFNFLLFIRHFAQTCINFLAIVDLWYIHRVFKTLKTGYRSLVPAEPVPAKVVSDKTTSI